MVGEVVRLEDGVLEEGEVGDGGRRWEEGCWMWRVGWYCCGVVRKRCRLAADELIAAGDRWQRSYQAWQRAVEHRDRVIERAERAWFRDWRPGSACWGGAAPASNQDVGGGESGCPCR